MLPEGGGSRASSWWKENQDPIESRKYFEKGEISP